MHLRYKRRTFRALIVLAAMSSGLCFQSSTSAATSVRRLTTATLERITFFNSRVGYGLFEEEGSLTCEYLVAKTTDGGAHFEYLSAATSWSCADNAPVMRLTFDTLGDGFLYGPKLFVTHHGGRTWKPDLQPGTVVAVSAVGRSIWLLEGECGASAPPMCPLRLLESTDGGRSWSPASNQPPDAAATTGALGLEPAQGQSWLVRATGGSAYLMSNPSPTQNGSSDVVPLWSTSDDGATWVSEEVPCGLDALSAVLSVVADGSLVVVCAGQPSAGFQPKSMSVSSDEGRTWSVQSSCAGSLTSRCTSSPLSYGYLGDVAATSSTTAFVTGTRAELLTTHDGGARWEVHRNIGDVNGSPAQVIFFGASHGVVLGRQNTALSPVAIWHTSDGGSSWSALTPHLASKNSG